MNVYETLVAGRELLSDEAHWCQGAGARDRQGRRVDPDSDQAVQFCAVGAITRKRSGSWNAYEYLRKAAKGPVSLINDHQGHAAVLELYDQAIALAKEEEK